LRDTRTAAQLACTDPTLRQARGQGALVVGKTIQIQPSRRYPLLEDGCLPPHPLSPQPGAPNLQHRHVVPREHPGQLLPAAQPQPRLIPFRHCALPHSGHRWVANDGIMDKETYLLKENE